MTSTHESQSNESKITVTRAARAAMDRLIEANGEILFHLPGGCCDARTPVCLPAGDLNLGPRDQLVGHADGVPVYEMGGSTEPSAPASFRLDVTDGMPVGFSLSPSDGKCFSLRETRDMTHDAS